MAIKAYRSASIIGLPSYHSFVIHITCSNDFSTIGFLPNIVNLLPKLKSVQKDHGLRELWQCHQVLFYNSDRTFEHVCAKRTYGNDTPTARQTHYM